MRVFVQGATGVLGLGIVRQFVSRGEEVVGLTRSQEGAQKLKALGATPAKANIFDANELAAAARGSDLVVQAATKIPVKMRLGPKDFAENNRLRTEGAAALLKAAVAVGASHYLAESIAWVVQPKSGAPFDEESPAVDSPLVNATYHGEAATLKAAKEAGLKAAILRMGWFYGPESRHMRGFGEAAAKGKLPIIGSGSAAFSFLHTDDAAAAFAAASDADVVGIHHVVDDERATIADFISGICSRVGGRPPKHFPAWLARLAVGGYTVKFLSTPMVTSNSKFKVAAHWNPQYPSIREGLDQVSAAWRREGFLLK